MHTFCSSCFHEKYSNFVGSVCGLFKFMEAKISFEDHSGIDKSVKVLYCRRR